MLVLVCLIDCEYGKDRVEGWAQRDVLVDAFAMFCGIRAEYANSFQGIGMLGTKRYLFAL